MTTPIRRVALVVETSVQYGREILRGISSFIQESCEWSVFLDERELNAPPPDWLIDWKGDGIICRSTTPKIAEAFRKSGIAFVDLNDRHGYLGFPHIGSDMAAIGEAAVEHLAEKGFRNFAFCGYQDQEWSAERLNGVRKTSRLFGRFLGSFDTPFSSLRSHSWDEERGMIADWLSGLPKPLGIIACNDVRAHHVLEACRELGFSVPGEIALLGVDNSEDFCRLSSPSLSSVVPNAARIGYEAARTLDRLMQGNAAGFQQKLIPPLKVEGRQSTDILAIEDKLVGAALRHIRSSRDDDFGLESLLELLKVSRSTLERAFRRELGWSPKEEFRRVRLKRVKELLIETDWPLERIAEEAGFLHPEYMMVQFKRMVGSTPSQWRDLQKPIRHQGYYPSSAKSRGGKADG